MDKINNSPTPALPQGEGARLPLLRRGLGGGRFIARSAFIMAISVQAQAQEPPPSLSTLNFQLSTFNSQLSTLNSENAAGLQALPDLRLSAVETYLHKGNGGFVNYYGSDNSTEAGAVTESYFRLNPRVVFYGKAHYGNFTGRHMGGSAWINPYDAPFDLVEAVDTTRGTKNLEQYLLVGALSVNLWRGLSLGGRIDYRAANYAKMRDLRHVNKYSDLAFSAGANYAFGTAVALGLNYFYRYSAEDIVFGAYGNTDRQYRSLISFGGFFGRLEMYSDSGTGYTIGSSSNPLFNVWQGVAAQAGVRLAAHWRLFAEASGKWRSGEFGKRSTSTVVFTEHDGGAYTFDGTLSYRRDSAQHLLKAGYRQEWLENFENVYREENTLGNRSEIVYYGRNVVRDAHRMQANLTYTGLFGIAGYRPAWRVEAGANCERMSQTVNQYPYYRKQYIYRYDFFLHAGRTVAWRANDFGLLLGVAYGKGGGAPGNDGLYAPPSATQKPPKDFDGYLYHEFDYLAAARVGGQAEATYARLFRPNLRAAVSLRYEHTHALQTVNTFGNTFHFVSLSFKLIIES